MHTVAVSKLLYNVVLLQSVTITTFLTALYQSQILLLHTVVFANCNNSEF